LSSEFVNPIFIPILPLAKSIAVCFYFGGMNIFIISYILHLLFRAAPVFFVLSLSIPFYFFNSQLEPSYSYSFKLPNASQIPVYDFCIILKQLFLYQINTFVFPETFVLVKSDFDLLKIMALIKKNELEVIFGANLKFEDENINCVIRINKLDGIKIFRKKKLVPFIEYDLRKGFNNRYSYLCSDFKFNDIYICSDILLSNFFETTNFLFDQIILVSSSYWTKTCFTFFYREAIYCYKNLQSIYLNKKIIFVFDFIIGMNN
jgi:hypothetical protein